MARPRHKHKTLAERNGETVGITRYLENGEAVYSEGILELDVDAYGNVGKSVVSQIRFLHALARMGAHELFDAAVDLVVAGFPEWWKISGHYVLINQYTHGRTYTAAVMEMR